MNILWWILIVIGVPVVGFLYIFLPADIPSYVKKVYRGRYYAHRGLHNIDENVPENSLAAFKKAAEKGYGIELDVHLSADGQVVVFHDDDLRRMCGVDKKIADCTYDELQQYSLLGTSEKIPLFSSVLEVYNGVAPMIIEIKTGRKNAELCQKVCDELENYKGKICVESFDPRVLRWFKKHRPRTVRGQLCQRAENYKNQPRLLSWALGNCALNFIGRPHFIAYRIEEKPGLVRMVLTMGAMDVCWTSRKPGEGEGADCVIFENYLPEPKMETKKG
ncbi:MAG: glycerophosphodiester phosphodiesterase [Clostridia bacterium]|nr:glycerophosphodiester phosphodiesterase [Clostridia bacterium]